jgi:hypothetical protein
VRDPEKACPGLDPGGYRFSEKMGAGAATGRRRVCTSSIESLDGILDRFLTFGQTTTALVLCTESAAIWDTPVVMPT